MTAQLYNCFVFVSWSWRLRCNGNQALSFMSQWFDQRLHHFCNLFDHLLNELAFQTHNPRHENKGRSNSRCLYWLVCRSWIVTSRDEVGICRWPRNLQNQCKIDETSFICCSSGRNRNSESLLHQHENSHPTCYFIAYQNIIHSFWL